ncbi:MAG: DUF1214 domain-containing protein [Pseudomonadota bacterium]
MKRAAFIAVLALSICSSAYAEKQSALSPDEIRSLAKEVYIFAFPLVMNYRTMHAQAIAQGGFGEWLHLGASSPADTDIVTPNNDTPYSYAWVDTRAEPWVLTMPPIEDERFYTSQWDDLWGYVLDNPGSVIDGNEGHSYLLASPTWDGQIPEGIERIVQGESSFLGTLTRTQVLGGSADMPRVQDIQQSYSLQPLSAFAGTETPPAAEAIDWPEWTEGDELSERFFEYVSFLVPFTTPHPDDAAMYDKMALLGLEREKAWNTDALDPATIDALNAGISDARAEMQEVSETLFDPADFYDSRTSIGTDYINRAMGVYVGIFGNTTDQAVYLTEVNDIDGNQTDGVKHAYTVTFEAGNLPPVKYFWSYTMYSLPERLLVDNPIDRYSIGSSTPGLKQNEDGSLTIYISKDSPGRDKESNWLPAPDGPFWAVLRTYGPDSAIRNKEWAQPPFIPQK